MFFYTHMSATSLSWWEVATARSCADAGSCLSAGKTLIARQIGKMLNGKEPKIVNGPEILNKYVGASEENVRNLFKVRSSTCCLEEALPA